MCGIAGWFGPSPSPDARRLLDAMVGAVGHRGPDDSGVFLSPGVALGHARLAIIDPDGARQPMEDPQGRAMLVYNGEGYNFPELRQGLMAKGISFRTRSDTETALQLYLNGGIAALSRLSGMYALALWEPGARRGVLLRDRQGIKPLFYLQQGPTLLFASEAKGLLPALAERPRLDPHALHLLMNYRYLPGQRSLFAGIAQLAPGEVLFFQEGVLSRGCLDPFPVHGGAVAEGEVREMVMAAVRRHLLSDVPLGGYLSAGLDSATIAALVKQSAPDHLYPTFTIAAGDDPREAEGAARTAEILQLPNLQEGLEEDAGAWLPRLIWHLEVPKVNAYQAMMAARLASRHVKVVLSGLGGDEAFLGYGIHGLAARLETLARPWAAPFSRVAGHALGMFPGLRGEEWRRGGQVLRLGPGDPCRAYGILRNLWDDPRQRRRLYGPRLLDEPLPDAFAVLSDAWPRGEGDVVLAVQSFENRHKLVNDFLWQEDRLTMAFGVEGRTPFLDEGLVALLAAVPRRRLMAGGAKGWMRQVVGAWLPREILSRPKSGFQVSAMDFFTTHLRPLAERYLSRERLLADGLFNPAFVAEVLAAPPHKRLRWHYFLLYLMIGTAVWIDLFLRDGYGESRLDTH